MKKYVKLPVKQGCAFPAEFLPCGTPILSQDTEGDTNIEVAEDTVIMIGVRGEVYASRHSVFDKNYCLLDEPFNRKLEYFPTIKNSVTGEVIPLAPHAKTCMSNGGNIILGMPLRSVPPKYLPSGTRMSISRENRNLPCMQGKRSRRCLHHRKRYFCGDI